MSIISKDDTLFTRYNITTDLIGAGVVVIVKLMHLYDPGHLIIDPFFYLIKSLNI